MNNICHGVNNRDVSYYSYELAIDEATKWFITMQKKTFLFILNEQEIFRVFIILLITVAHLLQCLLICPSRVLIDTVNIKCCYYDEDF
jgi:hypothetical protein